MRCVGDPMAQVLCAFRKPLPGRPMLACSSLRLIEGKGILDDANANTISPRQVLITKKEELDRLRLQPGDLRENLVVKGLHRSDFVPGAEVVFPSGAVIQLTFYCEPCYKMQPLGVPLRKLTHHRGILGVVVKGGIVHEHDRVTCEPGVYRPVPEKPYDRFLQLVRNIPFGRVSTFRHLTDAMGVFEGYCRALPRYMEKALRMHGEREYPIHRVVDSSGGLVPKIRGHKEMLETEGVEMAFQGRKLCVSNDLWVYPKIFS